MHKFYRKNAVCTYGDGVQVTGSAKIGEKLAVLNGAVFDLATGGVTCAFQSTAEGAVIVLVSGLVSLRSASGELEAPKRFVQTFLLSRKDLNTFAIANDLHRFVDSSSSSLKSIPVVANGHSSTVAAPVEAPPKKEATVEVPSPVAIQQPEVTKPVVTDIPKETAVPQQQQQKRAQPPRADKKEAEQPKASAAPAAAAPATTPAVPAKPSGPPSYSQVAASKAASRPAAAPKERKADGSSPAATGVSDAPKQAAVAADQPGSSMVYVKNGQTVDQKALSDAMQAAFGAVAGLMAKGQATVVTLSGPKEAEAALLAKEVVVAGSTLAIEVFKGAASVSSSSKGTGGSNARRGGSQSAGNAANKSSATKPNGDRKPASSKSAAGTAASSSRSGGGRRPQGDKPASGGQ